MRLTKFIFAVTIITSSAAIASVPKEDDRATFERNKKAVIDHVFEHGRVNKAKWDSLVRAIDTSDNNVTHLLSKNISIELIAQTLNTYRGEAEAMAERVAKLANTKLAKENANAVTKAIGESGTLDKAKLQQLMIAANVRQVAQQFFLDSENLHDAYERMSAEHLTEVHSMANHLRQQTVCK